MAAIAASSRKTPKEVKPQGEAIGPQEPSLSLAAIAAFTFGGALVTWLAFPPAGLWPLAAVGPIGWLAVVQTPRLPRWSWWIVWLAGTLYWLLLLEGVGRAHISARLGWFVLAGYLALNVVLFVWLARVAVHSLRVPLVVAAPVAWAGIELLRGLGPLGFSGCMLGHAWVPWIPAIQVADLTGAYGVSFLVMLAAAGLASLYDFETKTFRWWPLAAAAAVFAAALGYGYWRMNDPVPPAADGLPPLRIALVQGSMDTSFEPDPGRDYDTFTQYEGLTRQALTEHPEVDLLLWPETVFTARAARQKSHDPEQPDLVRPGSPLVSGTADAQLPPGAKRTDGEPMTVEEFRTLVREHAAEIRQWIGVHVSDMTGANVPGRVSSPAVQLLVGMGAVEYDSSGQHRYNAALQLDSAGKIIARYDKMEPVAFGEYLPLGDVFPWLYQLTPMSGGLTPGAGPKVFTVRGWKLAPSICFESTIPRLIRSQVAELAARGEDPDLLVNITNDGWFWGSPILDEHLACGVMRAVENRKPLVIAANTGFSAIIDDRGQILAQGPRRATGIIAGEIYPSPRTSRYTAWGDWPAGLCLLGCLGLAAVGLWRAWRPAEEPEPEETRE